MNYTIKIKVDTNDTDYMTEVSPITQGQLDIIRPLLDAIKRKTAENRGYFHNYERDAKEMGRPEFDVKTLYPGFSEDTFDALDTFCPYNEDGFHTIESVEIGPDIDWERIV